MFGPCSQRASVMDCGGAPPLSVREWTWKFLGFMESLHDFYAVHWDHEPTPNPSQEGNGQDADNRLPPCREGSEMGRFKDSLHDRTAALSRFRIQVVMHHSPGSFLILLPRFNWTNASAAPTPASRPRQFAMISWCCCQMPWPS